LRESCSIAWRDQGASFSGMAAVADITGDSVTFGSPVTFIE